MKETKFGSEEFRRIILNVFQKITDILCSQFVDRAMAVSISAMFGRLGGAVGSNTAALLLDYHCEAAFYLSGSILISMIVCNDRFFIFSLLINSN